MHIIRLVCIVVALLLSSTLGFSQCSPLVPNPITSKWNCGSTGVGTGVTSITGTSNQITVTGTTTPTLSLPSDFRLPGAINLLTLTQPATAATLTLANNSSLITSGAFSTTLTSTATTVSTLPAGTHSLAPLDSPTFTTPVLGAALGTTIGIGASNTSLGAGTTFSVLDRTASTGFTKIYLGSDNNGHVSATETLIHANCGTAQSGYCFELYNSANNSLLVAMDQYGTLYNNGTSLANQHHSIVESTAPLYNTSSNCSSSASPAACSAAAAGSVVVAAAATTVVVNTTAVTANSQILVLYDSSLGTKLSVTCNTTEPALYGVTARTAGTSFTITSTAPITNPACFSYMIIN